MSLQPLDRQLDERDRRIVEQALYGIVELPDIHVNLLLVTREQDGFAYSVGEHAGAAASPLPQPFRSPNDITAPLLALGYLVETETAGHFRFTDAALAWRRQPTPLSNQEIQRRLGLYLFDSLQDRGPYAGADRLDLDEVARELQAPRERLIANARTLELLGYVKSGLADQMTIDDGFLSLTQPKGVQWANDGAPPIRADGSPAAQGTVGITLQEAIREVEQLELPADLRDRLELLIRRFDEETKKGRPSYQPLQDLLDLGGKRKEIVPLLFRLGANHIDDIERMIRSAERQSP